jgi:hypothetical protein
MLSYCVKCQLFKCRQCIGQQQTGYITTCTSCSSQVAAWRWVGTPQQAAAAQVFLASANLDDKNRLSTYHKQTHDLEKFRSLVRDHLGIEALPATYEICRAFEMLGITIKDWDGSTIGGILLTVSNFHEKLKLHDLHVVNPMKTKAGRALIQRMEVDFKKPSKAKHAFSLAQMKKMYHQGCDVHGFGRANEPAGGPWGTKRRAKLRMNWHHRIGLMFLNIGCLRQNAAAALRIVYRLNDNVYGGVEFLPGSDVAVLLDETLNVRFIDILIDADKVKSTRKGYIPEAIVALDARLVDDFLYYVRTFRPVSGGYLFVAPNGGANQWFPPQNNKKGNLGGFTNWSQMVQSMYQRAFPGATDWKLYGSHSGRKSLAQWLWDDGFPRRLIADIGGWFIKKDAMDLYFSSSRFVILKALIYMGTGTVGRMHDD